METLRKAASPLGGILLAAEGDALTGLWFEGQRFFPDDLAADAVWGDLPVLDEAEKWLDLYFSGRDPGFTPRLSPRGITPFRHAVWERLLRVPFGATVTYGELARGLGVGSPRAVGGAVGHNPISLLIPCHRVVASDGGPGGYAGGLWRKKALLQLEGIALSGTWDRGAK